MANLAIKGHATLGKEVIETLEMLGGINKFNLDGAETNRYYYIEDSKIHLSLSIYPYDYTIYTLEEFLEKFPYKVGDKVLYKIYGIYSKIKSMLWNVEKEQVFYRLESNKLFVATADELQPYKEETMETKKITITPQFHWNEDKIELEVTNDYEIKEENGKFYAVKKQSKYPKTHEECFNICFGNKHHIVQVVGLDDLGDNKELFESFIKLKICRDAYWKIAGEQMGLGKSWKQDYDNRGFIIANNNGNIHTYEYHGNNNIILAFPTAEMRNTFYENFKELINETKELL